ncbi:MAG: ArsR family transcriptional regulator [Candidatus Methanolliviera hydrocarbonicum]|uniref:ArsR family transcriptional regulator n=1 Tax=Candidatus Methanolliviera hydrocarbonicum TaxID=2491085 RepID=A0A520KWA5_9EURY|nr:MAG: ArsR family transcriptional regulator [Candidatus Methanolliviera hydrocarbonicum]
MKRSSTIILDDEDKEFVDLLVDLGVKINVAKILVYLVGAGECISRDIERGTDLRQPEVSMAMRKFRERGWIGEEEIKHGGKGRPLKRYKLTVAIDNILNILEDEKIREAKKDLEEINRLREMVKKLTKER